MKVLTLLAGPDDAFLDLDPRFPKNFVQILDGSLVETVVADHATLVADPGVEHVFLVREDEQQRFRTGDVLGLLVPGAHVVTVPDTTAGALCTALLAIDHIDEDELLVCNGDMVIEADLAEIVRGFRDRGLDGGIVTFDAVHPRWSFVRLDDEGLVVETAEKRPISTTATAGIYWFRRGRDFVDAAFSVILKDAHVGGYFYVAPVYNELVLQQKRIGVHGVDRTAYHSLADPRGVAEYEELLHRKERT